MMTIVLPSAVFTRHSLTYRIAGQHDMCTLLPLLLQTSTSEACNDLIVQGNCCYHSSVARRERLVRPPRLGKMGDKVDIFNVKLFIFCAQQILNYWGKVNENLINDCDFLNFIAPVTGGHCYCSPRTSKTQLRHWISPVILSITQSTPFPCSSGNTPQLTKLLQLYRAKCLLYISSAVTLMQSALSVPTVACLIPATQCNSTLCKQLVCCLEDGLKDRTVRNGLWPGQDS
jgi:hypothetical protein